MHQDEPSATPRRLVKRRAEAIYLAHVSQLGFEVLKPAAVQYLANLDLEILEPENRKAWGGFRVAALAYLRERWQSGDEDGEGLETEYKLSGIDDLPSRDRIYVSFSYRPDRR